MKHVQLPIYVVAFRDQFVGQSDEPESGITAFGTREDAQRFARDAAAVKDVPDSLYRICEYVFSGDVREVRPT